MMDPETIYEEETVELNTESDAKEQNTDSEGDMHEVVVGEEEVIEHHLDEVVIYDNPPVQTGRPGTRRQPQLVVKKEIHQTIKQEPMLTRGVQRVAVTPKTSAVKLMPGQKIVQMAKAIKMSPGQGVAQPSTIPLKRKADGSPMIVRLDNVKKARPSESPAARPVQQQNKVRIVRHSQVQTEMSGDIMDQYQLIIEEDQQKIALLEDQLRKLKYTPEMFENDDKRTEYFTGMETFVTMITLYNTCEADLPASSALSKFEIYILTLLKLRLKLPLPFLGYMFGVSPKAATYFYNECLGVLHTALREVFSETIEAK